MSTLGIGQLPRLAGAYDTWAALLETNTIVDVTAAYTAKGTDFLIRANATGGAFSVTLPPAAQNKGKILVVKRMNGGGNAVTLDGNAAETVDGAATVALGAQYAVRVLISNGSTGWDVLASI